MTIVVVLLCRPILQLMRTPENIIDGSYAYIIIIFAGIPVTYLYNMTAAIIRSLGDSRTPVIFLVLSAVLNIFLDLLCIIVLHMGVSGSGSGHGGVAGCGRYMLSYLYEEKVRHPEVGKERLAMEQGLCV